MDKLELIHEACAAHHARALKHAARCVRRAVPARLRPNLRSVGKREVSAYLSNRGTVGRQPSKAEGGRRVPEPAWLQPIVPRTAPRLWR